VKEFNSYTPLPENGLFSVPKGTGVGLLAVYYDHEAKDDHKDDHKAAHPPTKELPTLSCILKLCRNTP
ncbi:hypothetical protein EDD11_009520, partial [Mortierella claussenii]